MKQREPIYLITKLKVMVIKMLTELQRRMDQQSENLSENVRKYRAEVTNELENTIKGLSGRLDKVEKQIMSWRTKQRKSVAK